jgi:hypothetical protein
MVLRLRITMSALPLRTDMLSAGIDDCLVPKADMLEPTESPPKSEFSTKSIRSVRRRGAGPGPATHRAGP